MNHPSRFRRLPPVCFLVAAVLAVVGHFRFRSPFVGRDLHMDDGRRFRIFRHLSRRTGDLRAPTVLVIRFRFKRFSQGLNRLLSLIPVPLIGGFPGFRQKIWMVDEKTGDWQGLYEFESAEAVESYRRSFVLGVMNRRADPSSISYVTIQRTRLADYLRERTV